MSILNKAEKEVVLEALLYYRDMATHENCVDGGSAGAGLDHKSQTYKNLSSAIEKLR